MKKLTICLLLLTSPVTAQDNPREIFDHNYVKDGFDGRPSQGKKDKNQNSQAAENKNVAEQDTTPTTDSAEIKSDSDITSNQENKKSLSNSLNVNWVSLIVNALDKPHFIAELDRFQKLAVKNDFDIAEVIAVGPPDYSKDIESRMVNFSARGGSLYYKPEIPEKYKVTSSPALIVGTADGLHILEGVNNYDRYFNSQAEFIQ